MPKLLPSLVMTCAISTRLLWFFASINAAFPLSRFLWTKQYEWITVFLPTAIMHATPASRYMRFVAAFDAACLHGRRCVEGLWFEVHGAVLGLEQLAESVECFTSHFGAADLHSWPFVTESSCDLCVRQASSVECGDDRPGLVGVDERWWGAVEADGEDAVGCSCGDLFPVASDDALQV